MAIKYDQLIPIPDSPSDRVLNVMIGVESMLMHYINTDPKDKDIARQVLSNVRKCLAKDYDDLPQPNPSVKSQATEMKATWSWWEDPELDDLIDNDEIIE